MFDLIKQFVLNAFKLLLANKVRSFLTMLGIIIGVGAVIIIMAVGAGAQSLILAQVESLGSNLVAILPGKADNDGPPASAMGIVITTLTYEDAMALRDKKNVPNILEIATYSNAASSVNWGANSYDTSLTGSTIGLLEVDGGEVTQGRFFTKEEETNLARVAVLGDTVKKELFGESDAVGQRIKIKKHTFEVIGVMTERGTVAFQDSDDQVFIPIKTVQKLISGVNHVSMIRAKIDYDENIERAVDDIAITLRERHDIDDPSGDRDDFSVRNSAQALDIITTITDSLRFFLAAMAALSLVVGGIGIMNIMLMSVTERTREIGLRKAVGASQINIMSQFLVESIAVTFVGGLIGIIGGSIISFLIAIVARLLGYDWAFSVSILSIILALSVSMVAGLVFGLYPARKAASLEPVEALRHE